MSQLAASFVDSAQLAQGRAIRRVEPGECPVGLAGGVEIDDPLFEDLAQAKEQRSLFSGSLATPGAAIRLR